MNNPLSDNELRALLSEHQREAKKGGVQVAIATIFVLVGGLGGMLCLMNDIVAIAAVFGVMLVVGVVIFFGAGGSSKGAEVQKGIEDAIILPALNAVLENARYNKRERIALAAIRESEMFPLAFDSSNGSDLIQGVYKGLNIEMSDIRLFQTEEIWDREKEEYTTRSKQVFCGLWMICDFGKELSADVKLMERRGIAGFLADKITKKSKLFENIGSEVSDVETENDTFNKKFVIRSDNAHDAYYVLTPHMMEFIIRMDERANGDTYMRFARGGKVHIAVNSGRDAFQLGSVKDWSDVEQMRAQFTGEIRYMTDIIDELRLSDSLFRQA